MTRLLAAAVPGFVAVALWSLPAQAQHLAIDEPADTAGHSLYWALLGDYARPIGEFREYVRHGWGVGGYAAIPLRPASPVALRADVGVVIYGSETQRVCLGSCRIQVDMTTTNTIVYGNVGPQLILPRGPVRPYVNTAIGLAGFTTSSSVQGSSGSESPFASTTHQSDITFQWLAGGGFVIPVNPSGFSVDVSLRYHNNGQVEYLTKGDIVDHPDGSISFTPTRSNANLLTLRIGLGAAPMRPLR
jgi:hypothetical protein